MVQSRFDACWFCTEPVAITDWSPVQAWLAVEGCGCQGFFIRRTLWDMRVPVLLPMERLELAERLRRWRAGGREAWITTLGDEHSSPLVIVASRPAEQQVSA